MSSTNNPGQDPSNNPGQNPGDDHGQASHRRKPASTNGHAPDANAEEVFGLPPFTRQARPTDPNGEAKDQEGEARDQEGEAGNPECCDNADSCGRAPSLSPSQRRAIPFVASEPTITAASRAARVSQRTLHRWMNDPGFRDEVERVRTDPVNLCFNSIASFLPRAMEVMTEALENEDPAIRLEAANYLIDCWFRLEAQADSRQALLDFQEIQTALDEQTA